jgi:hypothetical protein
MPAAPHPVNFQGRTLLSRDSPDDSQTNANIRAFPARLTRGVDGYQQLGRPNDGRAVDLAIFTGIWTHSSCRLLFRAHRDNTTKGTEHRRFTVSINLNAEFEGGGLNA